MGVQELRVFQVRVGVQELLVLVGLLDHQELVEVQVFQVQAEVVGLVEAEHQEHQEHQVLMEFQISMQQHLVVVLQFLNHIQLQLFLQEVQIYLGLLDKKE